MHSDRFFFDLAIRYKYLSRVCRFGPAFLPFFANLFLGLLVILAANILSALLPTGARKKRAIRRKSKQARKSNLHFLSTLILAIRKRKGKTKPYAFFSISEREEGPATKPYKSPFPLRARCCDWPILVPPLFYLYNDLRFRKLPVKRYGILTQINGHYYYRDYRR